VAAAGDRSRGAHGHPPGRHSQAALREGRRVESPIQGTFRLR
jgi:hypothetical protein